MWLFIISFLLTYGFIHAVFYMRARYILPETWTAKLSFVLFLILMILSPVVSRILERKGLEFSAQLTAHASYLWMGFIFYAFWLSLLMIVYDLTAMCFRYFSRFNPPLLTSKTPQLIMILVIVIILGIGSFNARNIQTTRISIYTPKLPDDMQTLKVAQISDIHLGVVVREKRLEKIVTILEEVRPDLIVSTGDLVDGQMGHLDSLSSMFKRIEPAYGKYAITGNHEYYAGLEQSLNYYKKSGFTVLRNETVTTVVNLVGIDDIYAGNDMKETGAFRGLDKDRFTFYLKHRPDINEKTLGLFDLQLSGHTHGGQMYPFGYFVSMVHDYLEGFSELEKGSMIYVSRGTGTWGPQVRILSPPEITIFELKKTPEM